MKTEDRSQAEGNASEEGREKTTTAPLGVTRDAAPGHLLEWKEWCDGI
jgi:hypothetical protein